MYHVRFCVPERVKDAVGKGELHRSTGCRERHLAKSFAADWGAQWQKTVEDAKTMDISKLAMLRSVSMKQAAAPSAADSHCFV